jgi:peptide-methionine (S)-S-oxide reductase
MDPHAPTLSLRGAARFLCGKLQALAAVLALASLAGLATTAAAQQAVRLPPPAVDLKPAAAGTVQSVVFAGGCFWGVQAVFQHTQGVVSAVSGYAGGPAAAAHYEMVGSGSTGHAEAVQVRWDPARISYGQLLQIYFSVAHDPTQLNRQGPDAGPQYRSAIFYADAAQRDVAQRYIAQLDAAKAFPRRIVTQLAPLDGFYPAEDYHQDYATLHPDSPYIAAFDLPKIANLKKTMPQWYRETPVLVGRARS